MADAYGRVKRLRRQVKRHHTSEAEYIRSALRKHLKEELQAHLKRISDVGNPINDVALQSLQTHASQYTIGCCQAHLTRINAGENWKNAGVLQSLHTDANSTPLVAAESS
jgi:hypothetical protein